MFTIAKGLQVITNCFTLWKIVRLFTLLVIDTSELQSQITLKFTIDKVMSLGPLAIKVKCKNIFEKIAVFVFTNSSYVRKHIKYNPHLLALNTMWVNRF